MACRDGDRFPAALTLSLDASTWEQLEQSAFRQLLTVEDFVKAMIEKALRQDGRKGQRVKGALHSREVAPLDAFLPEGTDPFLHGEREDRRPGASSFEDIQTRMRFAGTPALFPSS